MTLISHSYRVSAATLFFAAALAPSAWGQVGALAAAPETIVVTGSRVSAAVTETHIDQDTVEARDSGSLPDVLRQAPGVSVSAPGGAGSIVEVFLRGAESNFTVVLIDGVRVNDPSNARGGGYDFATLSPDEVEQINIVRGALSAVHGSDAMAGLVSIQTRRPTDEFSARLRVEGGEDGYARLFGGVSGPVAGRVRGGAKAAYVDLGEPIEGARDVFGALQLDADASRDDLTLRAGVRYARRENESFPDGGGGPLYSVGRDVAHTEADELSFWTGAQNGAWSGLASYFRRDEDSASPAIAPGVFDGAPASENDTTFERAQLTLSRTFDVSARLEGALGADVQVEAGERTGLLDLGFATLPSDFDMDRVVGAVFAEARFALSDSAAIDLALRADDADNDQARVSGRASVSGDVLDVNLRATWASGHKLPSFYALGDTLVGNPSLAVETSEMIELAAERTFDNGLTLSAAAFRTRYRDLIDFDFVTFRLVNRSEAEIDGMELTAHAPLGARLDIAANATFSSISLDGVEPGLLNRPENYGGVTLGWRPADVWRLEGALYYVGERGGSAIPTGPITLDSYVRADVAVSRALNSDAKLFVAVDNVTDAEIEEAAGFESAGRRLRAGLSYEF